MNIQVGHFEPGTTAWNEPVSLDLVSYAESGEVRPLLAFPLGDCAKTHEAFRQNAIFGRFWVATVTHATVHRNTNIFFFNQIFVAFF